MARKQPVNKHPAAAVASNSDIEAQLKIAGIMSAGFLALQTLQGPIVRYCDDGKVLSSKIAKVLKDGEIAALGSDVVAAVESFRNDLVAALAVLNDHKEVVGK